MIIEKTIGTLSSRPSGKTVETVSFEWFEMSNKILKKKTSSGEEIGMRLSEPLQDQAVLYEDENRIIALSLQPCEVIRVTVSSMKEMGRACFELGNRHLPLCVEEDFILTPFEHPTFEYLCKLGFDCRKVTEKFVPEVVVRGHGHSHEQGHSHAHHFP